MNECAYHADHESRIKSLEERIDKFEGSKENQIRFQVSVELQLKNIFESIADMKTQISEIVNKPKKEFSAVKVAVISSLASSSIIGITVFVIGRLGD